MTQDRNWGLTACEFLAYYTRELINRKVEYNVSATATAERQLDETFAALADPTRRAILARLASGEEVSVTELAAPFSMSLPAVSKHLKVLEKAGLIARSREAQWRPCRIEGGRLKDVSEWVERYRKVWEERFDRLDEYLRKQQEQQAREQKKEND